ncbi:UPF0193 protein EVG1 homolog [Eumeta japonica]|uniref:UPF0193 protein EVG1 homolog n=1 Tax=Eumeta variegata TaxID=151549 RepID=A0A4C1VNE9_EUMVA|nr:UPF0193 protein EVG1 homolog [Eumeta japonica]
MRLQQVMAYGDAGPSRACPPLRSRRPKSPMKVLPSSEDIKNDLLTQIRERINWLAEMEALGRGAEHRDIIQDQIAERLRNLDALGFDSISLSARSNVSKIESPKSLKIETTRSHQEIVQNGNTGRSNAKKNEMTSRSSDDSIKTAKSASSTIQQKGKSKVLSRNLLKEENVAAYDLITSLQYTPRRRC